MNIEEFVNDYLQEHRHDVLLSPYNGLIDFTNALKEQMLKEAVEGEIDKASDAFADSKIDKLDSPGFFTTKHYFEAGVHWLYRRIFGKTLSLPGDNLIVNED